MDCDTGCDTGCDIDCDTHTFWTDTGWAAYCDHGLTEDHGSEDDALEELASLSGSHTVAFGEHT